MIDSKDIAQNLIEAIYRVNSSEAYNNARKELENLITVARAAKKIDGEEIQFEGSIVKAITVEYVDELDTALSKLAPETLGETEK